MSGPFSLFPEEVWEWILDRVAGSKDAWNLFRAFPELDMNSGLRKKKHIWLFGLILPHIIPSKRVNWIKGADLLNCRLVSKRWSSYVDNFLQTQNQLRAYDSLHPEPQIPGGFYWDNRHSHLIDMLGISGNQVIGRIWMKDFCSFYTKTTSQFLQEFETHPQGRNPFPARFVKNQADTSRGRSLGGVLSLSSSTFKLLHLFGMHIWHYNMHFDGRDLEPQYMVKCLRLLPNLRTLYLSGMQSGSPQEDRDPFLMPRKGRSLPHLPYLETLIIEKCYIYRAGNFLILRYCGQIRKLEIDIGLWKQEYSEMFPNLTELGLTHATSYEADSYGRLRELLNSIETPFLAKLMLKSESEYLRVRDTLGISIEDDIFPWLKRFPNIQYLGFEEKYRGVPSEDEGTLSPEKDSIPSLKFLSIWTYPEMSYNFLRCLPSLRDLHLHVHPKPIVIDHSGHPPGHVRIVDEIQTASMYRSNIWKLLPKLRTVTLLPKNYYEGTYYTFSREGYEKYLKHRSGSASPNSSADVSPSPLRPDIIKFLRKRKRSDWIYWRLNYNMWDRDGDTESDSDGSSNY